MIIEIDSKLCGCDWDTKIDSTRRKRVANEYCDEHRAVDHWSTHAA